MTKDEALEVLRHVEEMGDGIAKEHKGHECSVEEVGQTIRDGCRAAYEVLAAGNGPAQVATDTYRRNWDGIFGAKQTHGQA